jgi:glycosyltransferase involved in cell wall biosynthesis
MEMAQESAVFSRASCVIIPNPLDTEFWRPSVSSAFENSAAPDESSRPLRLLFGAVGGLEDPRKGWGLLRDALAHLKVSRPDILIHLEIFGQTGVFERSGSQSTTYLGTLSEEGMRKAYRHADVFVATPLAESFGQTVTEAQACGTPVIGTAAGGLKDTIMPGKTGHLVGARDYFELAARLAETFDFPRQTMEMGVNARERAERLWSMQTVGDQYVELYRRVFFSTTVL